MNIVTFILIVYSHVNGGSVASFQEFNSQKSCEYAKSLLEHEYAISKLYCVEK
jgi:hypothetical protein